MSKNTHTKHSKLFLIKVYPHLLQIETVLKNITEKNGTRFQLSILGKLTNHGSELSTTIEAASAKIKEKLSTALGKQISLNNLHHSEIGVIFIVGPLTSTFKTKIEDKELATFPAGLYGIFRGLGVEMKAYENYIMHLKNGKYLLFIRSEKEFLSTIKDL